MNVHQILHILIVCTLINYAILTLWFVVFTFAHDRLYRLHNRWFKISVEAFDTVHYAGLSIYKIGILLFNLAPLIALHFV